jgi:hypothetical protein
MSQAGQEQFVMNTLHNKRNGFFLEIGSNHPININNTYKLEKEYGWDGLMVEYDPSYESLYKIHRTSKYIIQDATTINYLELFQRYNFPKDMDYLQIDLEVDNRSTLSTLELLDKTLFREYKFATVTFEHDIYRGNYFDTRKKSRDIFEKNGYILVFPDVENDGYKFEDWYVQRSQVTFSPVGGLGNLLFCHNNAFAFAKEQNLNLKALITEVSRLDRPSITAYRDSIFKHLNMVSNVVDYKNYYKEPEYMYHEIPKESRVLEGYFQSYKYSEKYQDEITNLLKLNCQEIILKMKTIYNYISGGFETICVHVRRGDYFNNPDIHTILSEEYYINSLSKFDTSNKMLLIFSEDSDIKKWKVWENKNIYFVNVPDPLEILFLMTMCTHFIIANSTLSLQAYYMRDNKNAQLQYPLNWFGPNGPIFDMADLIPHN